MAFHFHVVPDYFEFAVRADQERAPNDSLEGSAHELLHAPRAIGLQHLVCGIAEQREVELLFGLETRQRLFRVRARPQDGYAQLVELLFCVAKLGRFGRSTGCVGSWKEKQQHALAAEIRKRQLTALVCSQLKVRSFVTDF